MISPRASGEFIAEHAKNVKVLVPGLHQLGDILIAEIKMGNTLSLDNSTQSKFHPTPEDPHALDWIFVVNCLNFSFWPTSKHHKPWKIEDNRGYFALCSAINRAMKQDVAILNPHFYSVLKENQLKKILMGDNNVPIPLLNERVNSLNQAGACLIKNFKGTFRTCVEQANNSAIQLLAIIINNFKSFQDEFEYEGSQVAFYKRAQMLIADIWICFKNEGIGHFKDINEITMFADYRVPQALLFYNVLWYSEELWQKIRKRTYLKSGCNDEIEIRGCTIYAVDLLTKYVNDKLHPDDHVNAILVDRFLWNQRRKYGKEIYDQQLLYHRVLSIYY